MQVEMIHSLLVPCVQHGNETKLANEFPLWITDESLQSFLDSGKQYCQHNFLVDPNEMVEFMR